MVVAASDGTDVKRVERAVLDATAGGLAGAVSRLVVGPLDVVKIRMQVQLEPVKAGLTSKYTGVGQALGCILREEGVKGLWRGTTPALLLTVPYCAVQFTVLHRCKSWIQSRGLADSKWATSSSFLSGAAAGASATLASYPFDLLRTVLASQGQPQLYRGIGDAAVGVMKQRGVRGLFTGVGITLAEIIPYAGVQFGTYDVLSRASDKWLKDNPGSWPPYIGKQFLIGLVAGMAGKSLTHPLDVVKKRYQISGLPRSLAYGARIRPEMTKSVFNCIAQIYKYEGVRGFFKGLKPSLIKAAPASAVTFVAYEFFIGLLVGSSGVDR